MYKKAQTQQTKNPHTFQLKQCKTQTMAGFVLAALSRTAFSFNRTSDKTLMCSDPKAF